MTTKDINTANRIKAAANRLFAEKGFGRTTTREIATEAGVNLALLNYYFNSKEELFQTIMFEVVGGFISQLQVLLNDDHSFEQKVQFVVDNYINLLTARPDLPVFMLSEIRNHPHEVVERLGLEKLIREALFFKELAQRCPEGITPVQIFMNLLSLTIFPFAAKPLITAATGADGQQFQMMMEQRRKLIPIWFLSMLRPAN
ncbi:MAG: TetR/AcrR family transcriptional regulator [Flavobacteriales bacterium]|nr:TetR/AcrR family transcriptional regulator [Flavobacteriales bacterium]